MLFQVGDKPLSFFGLQVERSQQVAQEIDERRGRRGAARMRTRGLAG
jgi:hypothetical protein